MPDRSTGKALTNSVYHLHRVCHRGKLSAQQVEGHLTEAAIDNDKARVIRLASL